MKKIIFVRYGQYENGHLTHDGVAAMMRAATRLVPLAADKKVRILSADVPRAIESAQVISNILKSSVESYAELYAAEEDEKLPDCPTAAKLLNDVVIDHDVVIAIISREYIETLPSFLLGVDVTASLDRGECLVMDLELGTASIIKPKRNNYAFIDAQNVHCGVRLLGWEINWSRFRVYLREKYSVSEAYLFIGYVQKNQPLYEHLQRCGFVLIFKPTILDGDGKAKGNCDADLVLHALLKMREYDKAVIVTSDGDFYSLVRHLYESGKLEVVLSAYVNTCSKLLRQEAKELIQYMDKLKKKIGKNENAPHEDETS